MTVRKGSLKDLEQRAGIALDAWDGAESALLDESDVREVGAAIAPGEFAAVVVYENLWVLSLAQRLAAHGVHLIAAGGIPHEELAAALDQTEPQASATDRKPDSDNPLER